MEQQKPFTRDDIQSGDILVWGETNSTAKSDFYLRLVRALTVSDYGHISIAWRSAGTLHHVEATQPCIRKTRILSKDAFYCIPLGLGVSEEGMQSFFAKKIGLKYSLRDAIYAYLGLTPKADDRYQCVELANYFCRTYGINVGDVFVPGDFVRAVMDKTGKPLVHLRSVGVL